MHNEREALDIEAGAEMALGNFAAAAKSFRLLLDLTPKDDEVELRRCGVTRMP